MTSKQFKSEIERLKKLSGIKLTRAQLAALLGYSSTQTVLRKINGSMPVNYTDEIILDMLFRMAHRKKVLAQHVESKKDVSREIAAKQAKYIRSYRHKKANQI